MKAVINGKRYNTEAPRTVCVLNGLGTLGIPSTDFAWWCADLYRTQGGTWFLAGSGGPMTRFAHALEGTWVRGGSRIIPLSPEEALDLLEREGDRALEAIEKYATELGAREG